MVRLADRLTWAAVGLLGLAFLAAAAASLQWRMVHDSPLFIYNGFLMAEHGWVPYRDFWDVNPPGTQLLHHFYVSVFGTGDRAFRIADLLLLGLTMAATVGALRTIDTRAAVCAACTWGLAYLNYGPRGSFQRDDLVLGFVVIGLWLALARRRQYVLRKAAALGVLFGTAMTLKPPSVLGLPVLVAFLILDEDEGRWRQAPRLVVAAAAGLALPIAVVALYLWTTGAMAAFLEIATRYWPLYTKISGGLATITNPWFNQWSGYRIFGRLGAWLWVGGLGLVVAFGAARLDRDRRRAALLVLALALTYLAYVGVQGKFFGYHWHPFLYFVIAIGSLALLPMAALQGSARHAPAALLFVLLWFRLQPGPDLRQQLAGGPPPPPKGGRPDEMAAYIKEHLRPGETVQPLDWTGGVLHAMLLAKALPATPYLCDSLFYHHVSNDYITDVRTRFLEAMHRARPQLVVEVESEEKPWVRGKDTTRDFNKLRRMLETHYDVAVRRNGYAIYERKATRAALDPAPPSPLR